MSTSRNSDWPAVFFLLLLGGALLTVFTPSSVRAQQPACGKAAEPLLNSNMMLPNGNTF